MKMRKTAAAAAAVSIAALSLAGCGLFDPADNANQNAYGPPPPEYWDVVYGTPAENGETDNTEEAPRGETESGSGETSDGTGESSGNG